MEQHFYIKLNLMSFKKNVFYLLKNFTFFSFIKLYYAKCKHSHYWWVSSRRDRCLLVKLTRNPFIALGGNKKETKKKRSFKETIVTTRGSGLVSLIKIAHGCLLKRPLLVWLNISG